VYVEGRAEEGEVLAVYRAVVYEPAAVQAMHGFITPDNDVRPPSLPTHSTKRSNLRLDLFGRCRLCPSPGTTDARLVRARRIPTAHRKHPPLSSLGSPSHVASQMRAPPMTEGSRWDDGQYLLFRRDTVLLDGRMAGPSKQLFDTCLMVRSPTANRNGLARRDREWSLNEGQIPNPNVVRVAPGTGYHRVEGNRRACA
jgi:hypothetical protein